VAAAGAGQGALLNQPFATNLKVLAYSAGGTRCQTFYPILGAIERSIGNLQRRGYNGDRANRFRRERIRPTLTANGTIGSYNATAFAPTA